MANANLTKAKNAKNDEFYTQYADIELEVLAYLDYNPDVFRGKTILLPCDDPEWSNFTRFFAERFTEFGLKKLISTSYAPAAKQLKDWQPSLFEEQSPLFDLDKSRTKGRIFVLDADTTGDGKINYDDLKWSYLEGDGDFRSKEVCALRDEADIIITNPPFSLFREFMMWIFEANKLFLVIGNKNAFTYKELFPLVKDNIIWSGRTSWSGGMWFETVDNTDVDKVIEGKNMKNVSSVWFTNIDHGRRHQPLSLMTMAENIKYSKHDMINGVGYKHYDNFDALEVPKVDAIPSDYNGIMGVPTTFLDKYCPEQFEIIGEMISTIKDEYNFGYPYVNGKKMFARILIRKINN